MFQLLAVPRMPGSENLEDVKSIVTNYVKGLVPDSLLYELQSLAWTTGLGSRQTVFYWLVNLHWGSDQGSSLINELKDNLVLSWKTEINNFTAYPPQSYRNGDPVEMSNLIFTYEPSKPYKKRIILAAHIDSKVDPPGQQ